MNQDMEPRRNYWTDRPGSYHELVARANGSGYIDKSGIVGGRQTVSRKRKSAVERGIDNLTPEQKQILADIVASKRAMVYVEGLPYAIRKLPEGWGVQSFVGTTEYILVDGKCTCPDSKFRDRTCKHVQALREFHAPSA
jgi:hypothetical protein